MWETDRNKMNVKEILFTLSLIFVGSNCNVRRVHDVYGPLFNHGSLLFNPLQTEELRSRKSMRGLHQQHIVGPTSYKRAFQGYPSKPALHEFGRYNRKSFVGERPHFLHFVEQPAHYLAPSNKIDGDTIHLHQPGRHVYLPGTLPSQQFRTDFLRTPVHFQKRIYYNLKNPVPSLYHLRTPYHAVTRFKAPYRPAIYYKPYIPTPVYHEVTLPTNHRFSHFSGFSQFHGSKHQPSHPGPYVYHYIPHLMNQLFESSSERRFIPAKGSSYPTQDVGYAVNNRRELLNTFN